VNTEESASCRRGEAPTAGSSTGDHTESPVLRRRIRKDRVGGKSQEGGAGCESPNDLKG